MASLASCIKKAGKALLPEDAEAIRQIHDDLVAAGVENPAEMAVREHLGALELEQDALTAKILRQGGTVPRKRVYARQKSLRDVARDIASIDILSGAEKLDIPGAKQTKAGTLKAGVKELGAALEARTKRLNRGRDLAARTERNREVLAEALALETESAMQQSGHAGDWYRSVIHNAVNIVSEMHPELKENVEARNMFMLGLAITSNGMDVDANAVAGEEVYQYYKENGKFPGYGFGDKASSMVTNFKLANNLIDRWGMEDFVKFLNTEFTVGELKTLGFNVSGENVDYMTHGSVIFGPKVGGGFFQNLMGNFNPLTMDRWFMRTWGRLTGTLMPTGELPEANVERFVNAVLADKKLVTEAGFDVEAMLNSDEELLRAAQRFHRAYARSSSLWWGALVNEKGKVDKSSRTEFKDPTKRDAWIEKQKAKGLNTRKGNNTFADKTELNKAAKNLDLAASEPIIAPRNGEERAWIRNVGALALEKLQQRGVDVDAAAMQALVWYPEKELYLLHGAGNAKAQPTDYEIEFAKLAAERGIDQSRIDAARSGDTEQRPAGRAQRDAGTEASIEESAAPAFTTKGRKILVHREVTLRVREQLPRPYRGGVAAGSRTVLDGAPVRQIFKPQIKMKNAFTRAELGAPEIHELEAGEVSANVFAQKISEAKKASPAGAAVYVYPLEEYENMRLFLAPNGMVGFALNGDDIVSVFKHPLENLPAASQALIGLAIAEGGRKLDAFDTVLPAMYSLQGFKTVARIPWNEKEKPPGWNKKTFRRWNKGEPDVVFMVYDQNYNGVYKGRYEGEYVDTYEDAIRMQSEAVDQLSERNKRKVRYRVEDEITERVNRDPESPLAQMHKLGATMEDQALLGDTGKLSPGRIKELVRDVGMKALLGSIPRRNLRDFIPEKMAPSLSKYIRLANRMSGRRNELIQPAEELAQEWARWARKNKRDAGRLGDLMHAATLAGTDPAKDYKPLYMNPAGGSPEEEAETLRYEQWAILRKYWDELPPEGQIIYARVRNQYMKQRMDLERALMERIEQSEADSKSKRLLQDLLRQKFEDGRVAGPYFPLARFGDRWSSAKDGEGNVVAYARFETEAEQREWNKEWRQTGYKIETGKKGDTEADSAKTVDPEFVQRVTGLIEDKDVQDEIWQMYLRSLPEMSMRKRFLHRKGRIGFAADALRAYANVTFHGAHQQAKLEYVYQMQDAMRSFFDEVREIENTEPVGSYLHETVMPLYNEMNARHQVAMNPRAGSLAVGLTGAGFLWYLGTTPAAAVVNLSQTPLVALPALGARFNMLGATKELMSAAKLYAGAWRGPFENRLRGDELKAFTEARRIGLFEKTQAHDLAGVTEVGSQHYGGVQHTTMKVGALLFHKAEQMNREVTFLAAYRLSRQAGRAHEAAIEEAEDLVWDSHFDYNAENRPRWMQGDLLRVLTLFKQYSLNMTYRIHMDMLRSFSAETPEIKSEARKRFLGMMMMAGVMSGITGLPAIITESVKMVANLLRDDDDEIDAEDAFRAYLSDMYGPKVAEAIIKGPIDALTGLTLSNRVSLNDLWMRDPTAYDMDKPWIDRFIMDVAAGPVIGAARDFGEGVNMFADGEAQRGVERMLPKVARDLLRAQRMNAEGVMSMHTPRDVIVPKEDITPVDVFWQAFGFTPARVTMQYEQNAALKEAQKRIQDRRAKVVDSVVLAMFNDDKRGMAEAYKRVGEFNRKYPTLAVTNKTINTSIGNRVNRSVKAQGGVALERRLLFLYDQLGFTEPRKEEEK